MLNNSRSLAGTDFRKDEDFSIETGSFEMGLISCLKDAKKWGHIVVLGKDVSIVKRRICDLKSRADVQPGHDSRRDEVESTSAKQGSPARGTAIWTMVTSLQIEARCQGNTSRGHLQCRLVMTAEELLSLRKAII